VCVQSLIASDALADRAALRQRVSFGCMLLQRVADLKVRMFVCLKSSHVRAQALRFAENDTNSRRYLPAMPQVNACVGIVTDAHNEAHCAQLLTARGLVVGAAGAHTVASPQTT
jgi:hypothetical protein